MMNAAAVQSSAAASEAICAAILSSAESSGSAVSEDVVGFVAESVAATMEDGSIVSQAEALELFQDSGLQGQGMDEDDLVAIAAWIECLTKGGPDDEPDGEEDEEIDDGSCEMCERFVKRTFHHLIPKEMHGRYLKKNRLPENLEEAMPNAECTRSFLHSHGVKVCKTCHWAIHDAEPNDVLAEERNTLALLLEHPKIYRFAKYNSKRKARGEAY